MPDRTTLYRPFRVTGTDDQLTTRIDPSLIPVTHAPEAVNRLHFSGAGFWYVCHAYLAPDSFGPRFRHRLD